MKLIRAFTLVELMVGVAITMLVGGGALIYINNFNSQNKVDEVRSQVESVFRMARSYAVTMQKPTNYNGPLNYVRVTIGEGRMTVLPNRDVGPSYLSQALADLSVGVSSTFGDIYFSAYSGSLMRYNPGNGLVENIGANESAAVVISSEENERYQSQVLLDYMGLVGKSNSYLNTPTPIPSPRPTVHPTFGPPEMPVECICGTCAPGLFCDLDMGCICQ